MRTLLISKFIKSLRQSINRKKDGAAVFPLCAVIVIFLVMLCNFMYRRNFIQINYEKIDTSLTDALLAGGVINYSEFGRTGRVMIQEGEEPSVWDSCFNNSYRLFDECLKANLRLDDEYNATVDNGIIGAVSILEYRVYNYIETEEGFYITEMGLDNGRGYAMRHNLNEQVYVNANNSVVQISETAVYGKIGFRFRLATRTPWLKGMPEQYFEDAYTVTRIIGIAH